MPKGKNASYRYRLIDEALRNTGKRWVYNDLHQYICEKLEEEFDVNLDGNKERSVSKRQLDDDIAIMRKDPPQGYSAPIVKKDGYVYYEDPDFSINNNPLNITDIESLTEILRMIKPFQALPHLRELESIIGKVTGALSLNIGDQIIELEHNAQAKGLHNIEKLYRLIKDGCELEIQYQPFAFDQSVQYTLNPYMIKEYNNRWFLIGSLSEDNTFVVVALDRILNVTETGRQSDIQRKDELVALQHQIIGVSINHDQTPVKILLWANPEQTPYISTKPIHPSQQLVSIQEDGAIFSYLLIPNFELEQTLLMFGERVKVLQPPEVAQRIRERLAKASSLYNSFD